MTRVYIDAAAGTNPKAAAGAVVFKDDAGQKEFTTYLGRWITMRRSGRFWNLR
ncbi:hypothetical protein [Salinicoccus sp. CNSTN-B1]